MNKTVKTWRIFLLGMCCILACLYLKRILCSFEIIKGDFLSDRIVCIFRKNCASVPEERSAIPLQTEQSSAG